MNGVLAALLGTARRRAELTQAELAQRLAKPQSFVAKYEAGERRLSAVELVAVTDAIGVNATELLTVVYDRFRHRLRTALRR